MDTGLGIGVGFVSALLAGMGASALVENLAGEPRFDALDVPHGFLGDRFAYDLFRRNGTNEAWSGLGSHQYLVNSTLVVRDENGALRQGLEIVADLGTVHDVALSVSVPAPAGAPLHRVVVGLDTGDALRVQYPGYWGLDRRNAGIDTDFGPDLESIWIAHPETSFLRFQGRRLGLGDDLTADLRAGFIAQTGFHDPGSRLLAFEATVVGPGAVDGTPALGIRIAGSAAFDLGQWYAWSQDDRFQFWDYRLPLTSTFSFQRVYWFAADMAYPLAIEDEVRVEGAGVEGRLRSLVPERQEATSIPWIRGAPPPSTPRWERGTGHHPEDGTASSFCFPIRIALVAAFTDPEHLRFQQWRREHPDAELLGASAHCREIGQGTWAFVFGTPQGQGYALLVRNQAPQDGSVFWAVMGEAFNGGPVKSWPFQRSELPSALVTFSEVERLWREQASPSYAKRPISDLRWGVYFLISDGPVDVERELPGDVSYLDYAMVEADDPTPEPLVPWSIERRYFNGSSLAMNVRTGTLAYASEGTSGYSPGTKDWLDYRRREVLGPSDHAPPVTAVSAAPTGMQPPTVSTSLLMASGFFVLFLAGYFFPILKYAASQFWSGLLGYAKLRRHALLENRFRDGLLAAIRGEPGITPPELHQRLGGGWSTIVYHLGVLEKNKLVSSILDGRHRRFFPVEAVDWSRRTQVGVLRHERTRALYERIVTDPGATQKALRGHVGASLASTQWHLGRLEKVGLIARERRGHQVHYFPAPETAGLPSMNPSSAPPVFT